jgi:hypothetical protein
VSLMTDEPNTPPADELLARARGGLLHDVAQLGEALTPVALVAQPIVSGLMSRPPKPEPPKVELPPGVDRD